MTLLVFDAHEGLKAAVTKVLRATWRRCRVHFARNAFAQAGKAQGRIVSAVGRTCPTGTAYAQEDAAAAHGQWRMVAGQLRPKMPKLATLLDSAKANVRTYMHCPAAHRTTLHSTTPIERLNGKIKRRTDVVGIFPQKTTVVGLVGAILLEQSDEWATRRADDHRAPTPRDGTRSGGLIAWATLKVDLTLFIVKRPRALSRFGPLPRRWIIERSFEWLIKMHRLVRGFEQ